MNILIIKYYFTIYGSIFLTLIALSSNIHAEESTSDNSRVSMGIIYAKHDVDMSTQFTRQYDNVTIETSHFDNSYTSNASGLFVGYRLPFDAFYINGQLFFDQYEDKFELTAGSSNFTNALNHSYGIQLMPGVYLSKALSIFGKLGILRGDFDFIKSSPTSTTYNLNESLSGYSYGIGLAYDITVNFTTKIAYSRINYNEIDNIATLDALSDQTAIEPQGKSISLILQYNFN